MSDQTPSPAVQRNIARWFHGRWVLPILNVLMILAIVGLIVGHFQEEGQLTTVALSQAVTQAFDQSQISATARDTAAVDSFLEEFVTEENFICAELVAHSKVLGGPVPPPGICDVRYVVPPAAKHTPAPSPSP
jgi:hypothetical protein